VTEPGQTHERLSYLDLMREIEDFFFKEADLLDEREYDEWLELLTEDVVYWMPMRKNVSFKNRDKDITAENDLAWVHDDKETLRKRVKQIQSGIHWADEPISRISHLISNIRLVEPISSLDEGEKTVTKCRFIVYRNRVEDETDFLVGRREDTLVRVGGELRVARRKVILDQSVLLAKNLTMFF
jgi:3-phenylpropionate/cinnamic acid dioxygenase small subunit